MNTVCEKNTCVGCMACIEICPKDAINIIDNLTSYNAVINNDKCVKCNKCHRICQKNNTQKFIYPIAWHQGWARDINTRLGCASGGVATVISEAFIREQGVVYNCAFKNGEFSFSRIEEASQLINRAGSIYVKSSPQGIYRQLDSDLRKGLKVLFIGLPCQVAAVKSYINKSLYDYLYTIDLVCHGTPSPKLLDMFLNQYGKSLKKISGIRFREKTEIPIDNKQKYVEPKGVKDAYTIAFLNGLSYTDNCYECSYARTDRMSDITLGDAWGTELGAEYTKKGLSLVLCQTEKGMNLVELAEIELMDIDLDKVTANNAQLTHSFIKPFEREAFFKAISEGKKFNRAVYTCYKKQFIKQTVKKLFAYVGFRPERKNSVLDFGISVKE